jgi:hypothetical protein
LYLLNRPCTAARSFSFLDAGDGTRQLRQAFVERGLNRGKVRNPPAQPLGGQVELLELNQSVEVREHLARKKEECRMLNGSEKGEGGRQG